MARMDLSELARFLGEQRDKLLEIHERLSSDKESRAEIGVEAQVEMVGEFMERHFPGGQQRLTDAAAPVHDEAVSIELVSLAQQLFGICEAVKYLYEKKDLRGSRCLKLLEELAELMRAEAQRDETEVLDALADMDYLVKGTAWLQDLPLAEAFTEVHRSNMTKALVEDGVPSEKKVRGPDYRAPDLAGVLLAHRREQLSPHRIVWNEKTGKLKCELCDTQVASMYRDLRKYGRSKCFGRPQL